MVSKGETFGHLRKMANVLIEAEEAWNRSESADCEFLDSDYFWMNHYKSVRDGCNMVQDQLEATGYLCV
jgi:hypothetical protein